MNNDQSIADVLRSAIQDAQDLVRGEIALAKSELREEVRRVGAGVVLMAAAAVVGIIAAVFLLAALSWARHALTAGLGADGQGAIVNIASVAGLHPAPGIAYYGVSKAALIGLTVQLAAELAPAVRVNAIAPAVVKTRFAAALYEADEAAATANYPLGRLGEPADVGAAAAFLASADAAWITGQTLVLDGGSSLRAGL